MTTHRIDLAEYGWLQRPSGRFVHPDIGTSGDGRRRLFTEAEALTLTAASLQGVCEDCGTRHEASASS